MSVEIPKEIWNDPKRLFNLFTHINNRLMELLKIEQAKEKRRKELEREAKRKAKENGKNNKRNLFY